jgi:hypothetical protein
MMIDSIFCHFIVPSLTIMRDPERKVNDFLPFRKVHIFSKTFLRLSK